MKETLRRILYVDDDVDSCEMMATLLSLGCKSCDVRTAQTADAALAAIAESAYDLYIFDLRMPAVDGLELCGRVRQRDAGVPIMIYSALAVLAMMAYQFVAVSSALQKSVLEKFTLEPAVKKLSDLIYEN